MGTKLAARVALLRQEAEVRGPLEDDEPADDGEMLLLRPDIKHPPRLEVDIFSDDPATRAYLARERAGLDCETALIQPGRQAPRLVVTGYQAPNGQHGIVTGDPNDPTRHARAFLAFTKPIADAAYAALPNAAKRDALVSAPPQKILLVNQNIQYDFAVIAQSAHEADVKLGLVAKDESWFEKTMQRIFELLDLEVVEDTILRERLIDLAEGTLDRDWLNPTAKGTPRKKSYNLGALARRYLNADLDKLTYRYGYYFLMNKPLSEYPDGAVSYLTDDVEGALVVAARQDERAVMHGMPPNGRIPNSAEQSKAGFSLQLVRSWGMRTDLSRVQQLDADVDIQIRKAMITLKDAGIIRKEGRDAGSRNVKLVQQMVAAAYKKAGLSVPMTESEKNISTAGAVLEDIALIRLRGDSQDVPEVNGIVDETKLMEDPLYAYSQYVSFTKIRDTYLPVLYAGVKHPICTDFQTILETGRISSRSPNLNNLPRGGTKTLLQRLQSRIRQCFVPRDGFVFCSVDYNMLELVTLAQCLLWFFGESKMAEAINAGFDLHLLFVAEQLLHITYEECKNRHKGKDKHVANMRQLAKAGNFGLGGGMGAASFAEFAKQTYNVYITEDEGRELKEKWLMMWPEMRRYFKLIGSMMRGYDDKGQTIGDIEQFVSGRIRGRARYCAAANSFFQGLAADGAKRALYALQKESYLRRGRLYGSRTVAFLYDEFIMEHPINSAHERAQIQADIAVAEMQATCPDVKVKAEPALMRQWIKEAEPVYDQSGKLIPFELPTPKAA